MRAALALAALLAACGSGPAPSTAPAAAPVARRGEPDGLVTMISHGAEPRHVLRYAWQPKQSAELVVDFTMSTATVMQAPDVGRTEQLVEPPTIRTTVRADVVEVFPDGRMRIEWHTLRSELLANGNFSPAQRSALESAMAATADSVVALTLDPRGVVSDVKLDLKSPAAAGMRDQWQQLLDRVYYPLPRDPVGAGARWESSVHPAILGATIDFTLAFTLDEVTATSLVCSVSGTGSAARQPITLPNGIPGELVALKMTSFGGAAIDLAQLAMRSTSEVNTSAELAVTSGGSTLTAQMTMTGGTKLGPKP